MKVHTKKKAYRARLKQLAKLGKINNSNGDWVGRGSFKNSMQYDFSPQSLREM